MLRKMKLGTKIVSGFVIVLVLTGIISFIGWEGMRTIIDRAEKGDDTNQMVIMLLQARRHEKNLIIREDKKYIEDVKKEIDDLF